VDDEEGTVVLSHQVAGWENRPLRRWVEQRFALPCRLANDTDAATLAEAVRGAGAGRRCTFYTNIGSGIGGGLARDGKLYTGRRGAMEFGHTWIWSPLEGRWDHVEYFCSGWAVSKRAAQMSGRREPPDAARILEAWQNGDRQATGLMEDVIETLARGLCNVVAMLNPDVIVIGGGMALAGAPLFDAIREAVAQHVFQPFADNFTIEPAGLGEMAVPVGALLLAGEES